MRQARQVHCRKRTVNGGNAQRRRSLHDARLRFAHKGLQRRGVLDRFPLGSIPGGWRLEGWKRHLLVRLEAEIVSQLAHRRRQRVVRHVGKIEASLLCQLEFSRGFPWRLLRRLRLLDRLRRLLWFLWRFLRRLWRLRRLRQFQRLRRFLRRRSRLLCNLRWLLQLRWRLRRLRLL